MTIAVILLSDEWLRIKRKKNWGNGACYFSFAIANTDLIAIITAAGAANATI